MRSSPRWSTTSGSGTARTRADSDAYHSLAATAASPVHSYIAATLHALWDLHDGRFDEAATSIDVAAELGAEFGGTTARQVVIAQRVVLMRERGDPCALTRFTQGLDASRPADGRLPVWDLAIGWLMAECGLLADAHERLGRIAEQLDNFRDLPEGRTASCHWRSQPRPSGISRVPGR